VSRAELASTVRSLIALGLTKRDMAELLRAHPRAIEALLWCPGAVTRIVEHTRPALARHSLVTFSELPLPPGRERSGHQ
jgi:hypothetical protein